MIERFHFNANSLVVEIASNDGYLLQHFTAKGIPVLGIEPAANIAAVAREQRQIPTIVKFFGVNTAKNSWQMASAPTSFSAITCWLTCQTSMTS